VFAGQRCKFFLPATQTLRHKVSSGKFIFTFDIDNMTQQKIQPPFLRKGDEVAIVSPSFCTEENILTEAVTFLEKWNLKVRIGRNAGKKQGPFAGSDEERLHDLQEMTDDQTVKAVICSRGGYGLSKIIDKVDFSALKNNPKWYSGFSDITVLHIWLNEVCGVMSIHGEMPLNFNNKEKTSGTFSSLKNALFGNLKEHEWNGNFYKPADVNGELTGGNLSLLYSLLGTRAEPTTTGKILYIEEVGEYYYHIDRMFTSLKLSGKLDGLSALVVGGMNKIEEAKLPWEKNIEETILAVVSDYNYPVLFNFPAGHIADNRALYIGSQVQITVMSDKATMLFV
jgi:muramoyltetrapeptide carboxypeptidase